MRHVEKATPEIDFMDADRPVRDAAEAIYDTFSLRDIKGLIKGSVNQKFDRMVDNLSEEDIDVALMIALNWAIEDSSGRFPEKRERELDWFDYKVPTWALPALINGDYSGLSDEEEDMVIRFEKEVIRNAGKQGHWGIDDDDSYFSRDNDINREGGDVVDAKYYIMESKVKEEAKTAKCPTCGGKYLVATNYCVKCKKKVKTDKKESVETEESVLSERAFDLGSGHLGNGIIVWNRAREVHGDYEKVAHIDSDRNIKWYIKNPPREVVDYVNDIATGESPSISSTQSQKVFRNSKRESVIEIQEETKIGDVILEKGDKIEVLPKLDEGVAETILQQLGGKRFQLMIGAKQISKGTDEKGNEYLSVKFPKGKDGINHVQISLTPRDTYDIKFGAIRGVNYTVKATFEDIYADMLVDIFEKTTGLYLSL